MSAVEAVEDRGAERSEAEGPWRLPEGWASVPISTIANLRSEKADPRIVGHLPFVGMDDIEPDGMNIVRTRPFQEMRSAGNRFYPGDLLYGRLRPYLNKTAIADQEGACSGELLVIRPTPAIDTRYLQYFMHGRRFVGWVTASTSGDRPRISFETAACFVLPLAPLVEQRRIVARIDALFAEIEEGDQALRTARDGLEVLRRALLKAAVTGELTRDWRERNKLGETGQDLVDRIRAENANEATSTGRGPHVRHPEPDQALNLFELPGGWAWARLGELTSDMEYGTSEKCAYEFDGLPVLRMGNIDFGRLDYEDLKFAPASSNVPILKDGDVLFNRTNSAELVGKSAVFRGERNPCSFASYLIKIRFDRVLPDLIVSWINSPFGRSWITMEKSQQVGQANLSGGKLKALPVPVPPTAEASVIVRRLSDARSAMSDTLALLDAEAADAARLRQSVLKAAFEGRLVPQDPADEPAAALLARLKSSSGPAPRRAGRRRNARVP